MLRSAYANQGLSDNPAEIADAQSRGWLVFECTNTTYCCAYHQGSNNEYEIRSNQECCGNQSRLFDAGHPDHLAGVYVSSSTVASMPTAIVVPTNNTTGDSNGGSNRIALGIGLGLGLPTLLATIAAIPWYMYVRKRKNIVATDSGSQGGGSQTVGTPDTQQVTAS